MAPQTIHLFEKFENIEFIQDCLFSQDKQLSSGFTVYLFIYNSFLMKQNIKT